MCFNLEQNIRNENLPRLLHTPIFKLFCKASLLNITDMYFKHVHKFCNRKKRMLFDIRFYNYILIWFYSSINKDLPSYLINADNMSFPWPLKDSIITNRICTSNIFLSDSNLVSIHTLFCNVWLSYYMKFRTRAKWKFMYAKNYNQFGQIVVPR